MDLDEDALNVLMAEGIDVPTAVAGSTRDPQPPNPLASIVGAIVAAVVLGLYWYVFR